RGEQLQLRRLRDYDIPLFDQDIEDQGMPTGVLKLRQDMKNADGFLIASPEYNSFFSGVLKNAIDWASRPYQDDPPLVCFKNKVAGLLSASPGQLGGIRGLPRLATLLRGLGTLVVPTQCTVGQAHQALASPDEISAELINKVDAVVDAVIACC
ncbi:MAG: NAD(P)H-dependent oxidoreductase, partial [Gammaproteobacteria bacterium]|nr:NAD(P)H-dependent oxidoreductase [Gammaproteobacteria bacterium]